ncbi:MAG: Bacterial dnaA protein helix-turn-helix [Bacteroidota bacterium]|jgi:chromosomal replication initiation ATPase DnaA
MNYMALPGIPRSIKFNPLIRNRDYVVRQLLNYFEITMPELQRRSRKRKVVQIRYIMFYYLYTLTSMTLNEIAEMFNPAVTDHTTVIYGIQFVRDQISIEVETEVNMHLKAISI